MGTVVGRPRAHRRSGWVVCATTLSTTAAAETAYVRLDYQAPEPCRSAVEFERQVLEHSERGQPAPENVLARSLSIRIRKLDHQPGYSGELRFFDRNARLVTRSLEGPTCDEVDDGPHGMEPTR